MEGDAFWLEECHGAIISNCEGSIWFEHEQMDQSVHRRCECPQP